MLTNYEVVLENSAGDLYTHSCIADSKRMASVSAVSHIEESAKLSESDYVIIECKNKDGGLFDEFKYEKSEED